MLISFNLLDVRAKSFDCECTSVSVDVDYSFSFHVDDKDIKIAPKFRVKVDDDYLQIYDNGYYPYEYKIQNWNGPYGNVGYNFVYDYMTNGPKCPEWIIYVQEPYDAYNTRYEKHHFYAADEDSYFKIGDYARDDYGENPTGPFRGYKDASSYYGKCVMKNFVDDPVVSNSNEPSNEPTDPNSNIPTVNSNKTLNDDNTIYFCGSKYADDAVMRNIPADVPRIIRFLYIFLQVLVPIGIVVVSSIDLFKAISAQKEDDIKKGQQTLIKRIVAAVIIFFVFAIVKLVLSVISDNSDSIIDCISCFLENSDEYCIKHVQ